ncbi:MAG: response regulator transcription factor [Clostridium sp.]
MKDTILVVEDEYDIRELLKEFLTEAGYDVVTAEDGLEALEKFKSFNYNLIILDIMLPKIDGYVLCEIIRKESNVPIIMLTALDSEENQLKGFDLNIDDYITKPFSMKVFLKRVEAVLRREKKILDDTIIPQEINYKNIKVDTDAFLVFVNGNKIDLTIKEYELLITLLKNRGKVLSRENLLSTIWGYDYYNDSRVIDTHIKNLRKKLNLDFIETIRGVGYGVDIKNKK